MKNAPKELNEKKSPVAIDAGWVINHLNLTRHPEGGWFSEVYRSDEKILAEQLPDRYTSSHCFSTSIYFMLDNDDFSAFHRISSDETWHFYLGSPIIIYCIFSDGSKSETLLGNNLLERQLLQFTIPHNCWFAAKSLNPNSFSLVGCTVSPGFEFSDFELAKRQDLTEMYPQHAALIAGFTRH
ncbi:MAG: cupin domain-containing protein [Bacteroidales bacterium]